MGLFGVLQPFSHFLAKMPAPLAQGSLIGFREQVLNAAKKFKQSNGSSFSKATLSLASPVQGEVACEARR